MTKGSALTTLFLLTGVLAAAPRFQEGSHTQSSSARLEGTWNGALEAGGQTLRLLLEVTVTDGQMTATLTSVDQGNTELAVDNITLEGDQLSFEVKQVLGSYQGNLDETGDQVDGTWSQGGNSLPLVFTRAADD